MWIQSTIARGPLLVKLPECGEIRGKFRGVNDPEKGAVGARGWERDVG